VTAIDWLLDSDPSVRWQVMRDLTDAPAEEVEGEGRPSRWNTLRALRVLRWYETGFEVKAPASLTGSSSLARSVRGYRLPGHTRPGSRVLISWSSQPLPSGSLNEAHVR